LNEARDLVHAQCAVYRNNRPVLFAACASAIESPFTLFADPGKYEWYSRDQIVRRDRTCKKCKMPGDWQSDSVI